MCIEKRLNALEDAHRALAAQHTALIEMCKIMLPFISADPVYLRNVLTISYDTIGKLMEESGQDDEYQADVRRWFDVLSRRVLEGANKQNDPHNPDARQS